VLRFTADAPGSFVIRGRFMSGDFYPGVTDAHVLVKGQSVFDGVVDTYRAGPSFRSTQDLMAGDVVDFAVGFGNGDFGYDTTLLRATIALIPEPSTAVLWVAGLCSLLTVNTVQAGEGVPVRFRLGGNQGSAIFTSGFPVSRWLACRADATPDEVEHTVPASASSLRYDVETGIYTYVWKTDRAWRGQCRRLILRLADGIEHSARFHFR
jgi:hypothetical protein